jgi:hypothetical protein
MAGVEKLRPPKLPEDPPPPALAKAAVSTAAPIPKTTIKHKTRVAKAPFFNLMSFSFANRRHLSLSCEFYYKFRYYTCLNQRSPSERQAMKRPKKNPLRPFGGLGGFFI